MPHEIQFDSAGHLYIAERDNHVIRKVDAKSGVISTFAGTGRPGFAGDGGPAAKAELRQPHSIAVDPGRRYLLICDVGNHRIRRVEFATGVIDTFAGTGERQPTSDGAPLKGTPLNGPRTMAFDSAGDLYVALREGNAIYRVDGKTSTLRHVAGTGEQGYSGDDGPARLARLAGPKGLAWSRDSLYVVDTENHVIRRSTSKTGIIRTVLGTGQRVTVQNPILVDVRSLGRMASSSMLAACSTSETVRLTGFGPSGESLNDSDPAGPGTIGGFQPRPRRGRPALGASSSSWLPRDACRITMSEIGTGLGWGTSVCCGRNRRCRS